MVSIIHVRLAAHFTSLFILKRERSRKAWLVSALLRGATSSPILHDKVTSFPLSLERIYLSFTLSPLSLPTLSSTPFPLLAFILILPLQCLLRTSFGRITLKIQLGLFLYPPEHSHFNGGRSFQVSPLLAAALCSCPLLFR